MVWQSLMRRLAAAAAAVAGAGAVVVVGGGGEVAAVVVVVVVVVVASVAAETDIAPTWRSFATFVLANIHTFVESRTLASALVVVSPLTLPDDGFVSLKNTN